ncbi:hypothetical protein RB195_013416 [Necator americanus]|uniref:SCP domain-containing protein n=1 Tax=Necator americanus TaxID=51031 RepID=A0ABR1DWW9_NECAM
MMSIPCILTFILIAVSLTESTHDIPDCPAKKRALSDNLRDQLFSGILAQKPDLKYDCGLELKAARILERSGPGSKAMKTLSNNKSRLFFEIEEEPDIGVGVMTKAALNTWKDYISLLGHRETVGCNYVFQDKKHKYICIFE